MFPEADGFAAPAGCQVTAMMAWDPTDSTAIRAELLSERFARYTDLLQLDCAPGRIISPCVIAFLRRDDGLSPLRSSDLTDSFRKAFGPAIPDGDAVILFCCSYINPGILINRMNGTE